MKELASLYLDNGFILNLVAGSVLEFCGDAMVNAANTGGITGFGLDEMVNRLAGDLEIKTARREFHGIKTGGAKVTSSYKHDKVHMIIHAVGPVYRSNALNGSLPMEELDLLLELAYHSVLLRAAENNLSTIGCCLLSAGVFRGERNLDDIIHIALKSIMKYANPSIRSVSLFAYTEEEQNSMVRVFEQIINNK